MCTLKKPLALLLTLLLCAGAFGLTAFAADDGRGTEYSAGEIAEHRFYQFADRLILIFGRILNALIPGKDWAGKTPRLCDYQPAHFYEGKTKFDAAPKSGAAWRVGFGKASFLTDIDPTDGSFYLAGSLEPLRGRAPVAVLDDQGVNTVAISDGDVTVTFSAIDGFGLARGDVQEIRSRLESFAAENGIISINVSALHQHSCIDTLGLGAPLAPALLVNPFATMFREDSIVTGRNPVFMENLYAAVVRSVTEAVESMTAGSLYYGSADVSDYIEDKRDPQAFDGSVHRLRFVPDHGGNEIWICEAGVHPTSVSSGSRLLSADFPHYIEAYARENAGAQMVYIQGAELAISRDTAPMQIDPDADEKTYLSAMGAAYGARILGITNDVELPPLLNIAHREVTVRVENPIHTLAAREGLLASVFARDGFGYAVVTELGYMELGGRLGVALAPGEMEPAILWGGAATAAESWTGETWDFEPWEKTCGAEKLLCFGLCNDQIGYILCDNDVRSMLIENEEINAVSTRSGSTLTAAFEALISAVK